MKLRTLCQSLSVFLLVLLILSPLSRAGDREREPPLLLDARNSISLSGHFALLKDPDGRLELIDVLSRDRDFTPIPGFLTRGYTTGTSWLRFTMQPGPGFPAAGYLCFDPARLDTVDVHLQTGPDPRRPQDFQGYRLGSRQPAYRRPELHPNFVVPFSSAGLERITVYLKVGSSGSVHLSGMVHTRNGLIAHNYHIALIDGGYLLATLAIALINLIYFIRTRDPIFKYYTLFLFALFTLFLGSSGLLVILWPAVSHYLSGYLAGVGSGLAFCFIALFAMHLFQTRRFHPRFHILWQYYVVFGLMLALAVVPDYYGRVSFLIPVHGLAGLVLLTILSICQVRRGETGARIYLAAILLGNICLLVGFLQLQGLLPAVMARPGYTIQAGTLVQMILMSFGFTERLRAAEARALLAVRQSEQQARQMAAEMTRQYRDKQEELENALERENEAAQEQSRLVALIAHEYRNPLAIINTNLDILLAQAEKTGGEIDRPRLSKMKRAVARLAELMDNALTSQRLSEYLREASPQPLELAAQLRSIVEDCRELWPEREFKLNLPAYPITIAAAQPLFKTVILNLLDNAHKYSPAAAQLEIEIEQRDNQAFIRVRDRGPGIALADRQEVFSKYFRGTQARSRAGVGLGLFLANRIVEQFRGQIILENNRTGPGLTVTLVLPVINTSGPGPGPDGRTTTATGEES